MSKQKIWDALLAAGLTSAGAAGVMGNLMAESALCPKNLQNSYENALGFDDESYTQAVDEGRYQNFATDRAGYGLAQWTYPARKRGLLEFAQATGRSIGDLTMQTEFLISELQNYPLWAFLRMTQDVANASERFMLEFECPADTSSAAKAYRASLARQIYEEMAASATPKTIETLAGEVLQGVWGNGVKRRERLEAAGYDYAAVQREVNAILGSSQRTHRVVKGDTLSAIARHYGTTVQAILAANRGRYPRITADYIRVGWEIEV